MPLADYLARTLDEMSGILRAGGYPVRIGWDPPEMERPLTPLEADVLGDIKDAIVHFAEAPSSANRVKESKKEGGGFFVADVFTNADYVHYALRTTVAAMFCYLLYSLLDWPGIHTCFLTIYIVSLGTTAKSVEKLTLRIVGCLVGAAAGYATMIFMIPYLTSITALMIVVFVGALAAGYVSAGSERISYAGFQMAFAFFLCVIQGPSPAFDLSTARDRVIGILLGNVVAYLVMTNLWPISVGKRIDPAIAALLRRLAALMTADKRARPPLAAEAQSQLAEIETDIDLAAYEPGTLRPNAQWLAARRKAANVIGAIGSPLLLDADKDRPTSAQIAKRLEDLASRFSVAEPPPPLQAPTDWSASPLFPMIDGESAAVGRSVDLRGQKERLGMGRAVALIGLMLVLLPFAGCANWALDMAPDRHDAPSIPATSPAGEIAAGERGPRISRPMAATYFLRTGILQRSPRQPPIRKTSPLYSSRTDRHRPVEQSRDP